MRTVGVVLLLLSASLWGEELKADAVDERFKALLNQGKAEECESLARALLAQEEASGRPESEAAQLALDLLLEVFVYRENRSTPEIDEIGNRAVALHARLQGPDSMPLALSLRLWATAQLGLGNYSSARGLVERSVKIYEKLEQSGYQFSRLDTAQYSRAVGSMAGILAFMKDWHSARRAQMKSIALKSRLSLTSPGIGTAYLNLGRLDHYLGSHAEALENYAKARPILVAAMEPDNPVLPEEAAAEAYCLYETGRKTEGLAMMEAALAVREKIHGKDGTDVAPTLDDLAWMYRMEGRFGDALLPLERGLRITRKAYGELHPDIAESEHNLALALLENGDRKGALDHALEGERVSREHLSISVATLPEREATLFALKRNSSLDTAVSVAVESKGDSVGRVYDTLVRSRSIVFDELASRHRVQGSASEDSELIAKLSASLRAARERLARLALATGDRGEELQKALDERDALDRQLAAASLQYKRRKVGRTAGLPEVTAALPPDTALVSYVRFEHGTRGTVQAPEEYAAFVLTKGTPVVIPLGSGADIGAAVDEVRGKLAAEAAAPGMAVRRNEAAYRISAEKLRKLVWDPLDRYVAGAKRIFIVPDGALHVVNFAALPEAGVEGRYLIERGALFHYLSTERDLVAETSPDPAGAGLLAVGNPSFNRPELARGKAPGRKQDMVAGNTGPVFRGARSNCSAMQAMQFADLPSSGKEVDTISRIWKRGATGEVVELTGELAGPDRFRAMAPGRRMIHLAVHGFAAGNDCADPVRNENPLLLTGLAMAGANRRGEAGEDGIITAEEIASLDLRGVEWAVLSACDSGLGKTGRGEGVFGLQRAFQIAGAHTVIMSLWPVEDKVTSDWMQSLYEQRLSRKMDTASSVRLASLDTLKKRRAAGQGAHPFYWAPFVAIGDWR